MEVYFCEIPEMEYDLNPKPKYNIWVFDIQYVGLCDMFSALVKVFGRLLIL